MIEAFRPSITRRGPLSRRRENLQRVYQQGARRPLGCEKKPPEGGLHTGVISDNSGTHVPKTLPPGHVCNTSNSRAPAQRLYSTIAFP